MNTHIPCAQADGDPGVSRRDVALGALALVAAAQEAGISCLALLCLITETYETVAIADVDAFRDAAERITG